MLLAGSVSSSSSSSMTRTTTPASSFSLARQAPSFSHPRFGTDASADEASFSPSSHSSLPSSVAAAAAAAVRVPPLLPRNQRALALSSHADALAASPSHELPPDGHANLQQRSDDSLRRSSSERERLPYTNASSTLEHRLGETAERVAPPVAPARSLSHDTVVLSIPSTTAAAAAAAAAAGRSRAATDSRLLLHALSSSSSSSPASAVRVSISSRSLFSAAHTSHATSVNEAERSSTQLAGRLRVSVDDQAAMTEIHPGAYRAASDGALPEDDGMGRMRRRILDIQSMPCSSADKSRMIHSLMIEQYSSSLPHLHSPTTATTTAATTTTAAAAARPRSPAASNLMSQDRPFTPLSNKSFNIASQNASPPTSRSSVNDELLLSDEDRRPTYWVPPPNRPSAPATANATPSESRKNSIEEDRPERPLGCQHYKRNVKLQCSTCSRWYTCRFCHDEIEDHPLIRRETRNMLCMLCGCAQPAAEECRDCCERAAWYYCDVCKLWDNDAQKSIYHCDECGICRIGQGLGKDFFHCKTCLACLSISIRDTHRCIERSTDCDCPICGEYMFTSPQTVVFMRCGHSIHHTCYKEHMKRSFKCPICSRSIINMEITFRHLDQAIRNQPMPAHFRDTKAFVYCNDCCAKSSVQYHWLGLKCAVCDSYNTAQLQMHSESSPQQPPGGTVPAAGEEEEGGGGGLQSRPSVPSAAATAVVARGRSHTINGPTRRTATSASAVQNLRLPALDARISQTTRSSSTNNMRYYFPISSSSGNEDDSPRSDDEMDTGADLIGLWRRASPAPSSASRNRRARERRRRVDGPSIPVTRAAGGNEGDGTEDEDDDEDDEDEDEDDDDDDDDVTMGNSFDYDDSSSNDSDDDDGMEIFGHR